MYKLGWLTPKEIIEFAREDLIETESEEARRAKINQLEKIVQESSEAHDTSDHKEFAQSVINLGSAFLEDYYPTQSYVRRIYEQNN